MRELVNNSSPLDVYDALARALDAFAPRQSILATLLLGEEASERDPELVAAVAGEQDDPDNVRGALVETSNAIRAAIGGRLEPTVFPCGDEEHRIADLYRLGVARIDGFQREIETLLESPSPAETRSVAAAFSPAASSPEIPSRALLVPAIAALAVFAVTLTPYLIFAVWTILEAGVVVASAASWLIGAASGVAFSLLLLVFLGGLYWISRGREGYAVSARFG